MRGWRPADRDPFAQLNADPRVMEHFPAPLSRVESDAFVDIIGLRFSQYGFGLWAVEVVDGGEFIGFVGLNVPRFDAPFQPAVEIGWRLAATSWGHGYASEAAKEALRFAFEDLGMAEIVSFTTPVNERSQAVMRRIGMHHDPGGDFDHPQIPDGHPLRFHVLYRITRDGWYAG